MMKEIKDYLPFYLGCECLWEDREGNTGGRTELDIYTLIEFLDGRLKVKPILRPVRDILNTEAVEVYKIYFGVETATDWTGDTGSAYFQPKQRRIVADDAVRIITGSDYITGDFLKVVEVSNYLRKICIDIDGLIEAGLAIDKTTLKV